MAAQRSKPVDTAAERSKRAGIAAEWSKPAGVAAERSKPVGIGAERSALPADMPAAVPIEMVAVPVDLAAVPEFPAETAAGPVTDVPAEPLAEVAADAPDSPVAAPPELPTYVVVEESKPAEPPFGSVPTDLAVFSADVPDLVVPLGPTAATTPEPARRFGLGAPLPPGVRRVVDQAGPPLPQPPAEPAFPTQRTERPPDDLMAMVGAAHGVDVSGTWVHRGTEVTARADAVAARAFTAAGTVYLPDAAGPLATVGTRATLAHELTHVAQQRTLGPALPAEWTPAGQALESEAVLAERWVLAGSSGSPLVHAPVARALATTGSTSDGVQRQPVTELSWTAPAELLAQLTGQAEAPVQPEPAATGLRAEPIATAAPENWPDPPMATVQPAGVEPARPEPVRVVDQELVERRDRLLALCAQRPANLDDVLHMEELAVKLYHRLRTMLRGELIVDRERAGLLTDFR